MSKTVAITEGDRAYRFGKCSYLRTNKQGGGYAIWVPEDDRETTTKHITKDGTYKISDEKKTGGGKYYGFSEVSVNVPDGNKAVGKKPDGNTHVVQPDPENDDLLNDKIIPDSIRIITQPYKLDYEIGETISKSGMVVKAYQGDGSIWEASGYSSGIIPHNELTLKPSTAQSTGTSEGTVDENPEASALDPSSAEKINFPIPVYKSIELVSQYSSVEKTIWTALGGYLFAVTDHRITGCGYSAFQVMKQTTYYNTREDWENNNPSSVRPIEYQDVNYTKTMYGKTFYYGGGVENHNTILYNSAQHATDNNIESVVDFIRYYILFGNPINGFENNITVSWARPDDGKELADNFAIQIV